MNTWITLTDTFSRLAGRAKDFNRRTRTVRRRLAVFLAVVGPGLITSNVDNDAGGISVYSAAGAQFGYTLLWSLIPMTIALYVSGEMCARMGVITGKGLSDLIREEFGFRSTFFVMVAAFFVNLFNTVAEFSGVAAASQILHVSKYVSVPLAAIIVWLLVVYGTYRIVEKIFLVACVFYLTYVVSAFLAKPDWLFAAKETVLPSVPHERALPADADRADRHHDRAVAIFLYAGGLRRKAHWAAPVQARASGRSRRQRVLHGHRVFHHRRLRGHSEPARADEYFQRRGGREGSGSAGGQMGGPALRFRPAERVAFRRVDSAAFDRARDLRRTRLRSRPRPTNSRKRRRSIRSTRCRSWSAPAIILIPRAPLWKILIYSQVGNGIWLPVVLIFILMLINRRDLMGDHTNSLGFNIIAWGSSISHDRPHAGARLHLDLHSRLRRFAVSPAR